MMMSVNLSTSLQATPNSHRAQVAFIYVCKTTAKYSGRKKKKKIYWLMV